MEKVDLSKILDIKKLGKADLNSEKSKKIIEDSRKKQEEVLKLLEIDQEQLKMVLSL